MEIEDLKINETLITVQIIPEENSWAVYDLNKAATVAIYTGLSDAIQKAKDVERSWLSKQKY